MSPHHPQSFPCLVQCDSLHPISEEGPRPPATAPESGRPTSRLLTSSLHVLVTCAATTPSRAPITTHRLTPSASLQVPSIQVRRTKVTSCRHGAFLPVCEQHFLFPRHRQSEGLGSLGCLLHHGSRAPRHPVPTPGPLLLVASLSDCGIHVRADLATVTSPHAVEYHLKSHWLFPQLGAMTDHHEI